MSKAEIMFGESTNNNINDMLIYHKKQVISNEMNENRKDTKGLFFKIINKLTDKTAEELAEDFITFFLEKINKI